MLHAEQRLRHATEEEAKRRFPMESGPTAMHHPALNSQCTQWFRAEEFPLLCPTPKVMPRFSLFDVGEARWPLSHRWTDASSTLPVAAHDSRNQGRVVSLSELSLLSACVRLRVLPSQSSVRSLLVLLLYKQRCLSCLARPVWGTNIGRCRGVLPSMKYIYAIFSKKCTANIAFGTIFEVHF